MKIVKASAGFEHYSHLAEQAIEEAGRTCYKSEDKITVDSAQAFVRKIVALGHESVLEHVFATVRFVVDRGISHELVRHRLASFSQESTRYVTYRGPIEIIHPGWSARDWSEDDYGDWSEACQFSCDQYRRMLTRGRRPQEARAVLPTALKTEVVMTANMREWRHVFRLRCSPKAHPQMREVMIPLMYDFRMLWPGLFGDLSRYCVGCGAEIDEGQACEKCCAEAV